MPEITFTQPDAEFQPLPIIPRTFFAEPYQKILNKIHRILTKTERRLLTIFEGYCYQDGKIYPKQKSIAFKLGVTTRQVQRLIKSLLDKKFIKVTAPTLVERHLYGKGNHYTLINHPAYFKMSSQMSSENGVDTINKNKLIKTKDGFNVLEFLKKNGMKHPQAVADALKELTKRWPSIKFPEKYADKIISVQSGNYFAADHTAEVKQEAAEIQRGQAKLAEKLGFSLSGERSYQKSETPAEIMERMNRQRNELLDKFG